VVAVRLMAWRSGKTWTAFHVAHLGRPACGTPLPAPLERVTVREAQIKDWLHLCERCKEAVLRLTPAPCAGVAAEDENCRVCGGYKRGLDGHCVDCCTPWPIKTAPLGRGKATEGPNGRAAAAGAVHPEPTLPARDGQT